jgi:hypothetical protein
MKTAIHSHCPVGIPFAHLQANDSTCVGLLTVLESSLWPGNFYHMYIQGAKMLCVFFQHFVFVKIHVLEAGYAYLIR